MDMMKNVEEPVDCHQVDESPLFALQYSVVKNILEKLPIRDLLSASQTCSSWADIGRTVRRQRKNRSWVMLYHPYGNHTLEAFEYFNDHAVSDAAKEFIQNAHLQGFPSVHELITTQSWALFPWMVENLQQKFFDAYFEPQMLVVVATASVDEYNDIPGDHENSSPGLKNMLGEIYKRMPILATFSYGIVASLPKEPKSLEMENSEFPLVSSLAIPKVPGLKVKMFIVTKELNSEYKGLVNSENCKTILNISPEDNVKGIILFHTDIRKASSLKDAIFQYLKENPHVALGGGAHYRNLASICKDGSPIGAGMIVCGDENVTVASVGLFDSKISKKNEDKIIELKSCEMPGGDSFAFMFACNGRGAHMHGTPHVESVLFRKHFPTTNLIGTFTGGEFCHEVIPTRNVQVPPPKRASSVEFAFATIFVLVSYRYPPRRQPPT